MESESPTRYLSYILLLATFFVILFLIDEVLGLRYEPNEHRLNREGEMELIDEHSENLPTHTKEKVNAEESAAEKSGHEQQEAGFSERADDQAFFEALKKKYQEEVLTELPANKSRSDIVIRYYRHPPDGNSAYALQKLRYYIHERPVDPEYENVQSNAIYYGDSVALRDIHLVTYTLLREGLPIKTIAPSRFGDSWKSNSIEIGADTTLIALPTLSLAELRQFSL